MITFDTNATIDIVEPFAKVCLGLSSLTITTGSRLGNQIELDNEMSLLKVEVLRSVLAERGYTVIVVMTP